MTTPNLQARRATVDDLTTLRPLWESEGLPAEALAKRVSEFQLVEVPGGAILAALGLQIAGLEGRIHSEAFADPAQAEDLRARLHERILGVAKNHGLLRVWTQLATPFWHHAGLKSATPDVLAKLTRCFTAHFPEFRKNQVELLSLMVLALLGGKDVRHAELAARFPGSAHTDSVIRRVERFFDRHPIQPADVARVVLTLLPSAKPREFILDRTNWKYGQTDVNVLLGALLRLGT